MDAPIFFSKGMWLVIYFGITHIKIIHEDKKDNMWYIKIIHENKYMVIYNM